MWSHVQRMVVGLTEPSEFGCKFGRYFYRSIVSQPSKCPKFMTFREGCLSYAIECKYSNKALKTF